jgi:glycogen synthase
VRILQLSWEYPPLVYGGLGRHVHALAEAQARLGHDVTVLTQCVDGSAVDEQVAGVRVVRVPADPPDIPRDDLFAWVLGLGHTLSRAGTRLGDEIRPDVVHAHDWVTCHAGVALQQALRAPLVATIHATEAGRHQGWLPGPLSRAIHTTEAWLTRDATRLITCSLAMREEVTRLFDLPWHKVEVIANGIDLTRWTAPSRADRTRARRSWAPDGPLLAYAGRLEYEKGVHTLLDAIPRLRRRHRGLRVVVAGKGSYGDQLREQARRLRLGSSVVFAGYLSDHALAALVGAADVAVVPSLYEPFGLVALEAAALQTPVVAADTGGLHELIEPSGTGLLFSPGDASDLVRAVDAQLDDPVAARRMARTARAALATGHDWSLLAGATVAAYQRAADDTGLPHPA